MAHAGETIVVSSISKVQTREMKGMETRCHRCGVAEKNRTNADCTVIGFLDRKQNNRGCNDNRGCNVFFVGSLMASQHRNLQAFECLSPKRKKSRPRKVLMVRNVGLQNGADFLLFLKFNFAFPV